MADRRRKNVDWNLPESGFQWEHANMAVLMDIRDELQTLNRLLACPNFTAIPTILRTIRRNTSGLREKKKPARRKV